MRSFQHLLTVFWVYFSQSVKLTTRLCLLSRLRMKEAKPLLSLYAFMACIRDNFAFTYACHSCCYQAAGPHTAFTLPSLTVTNYECPHTLEI
jgi:hypothetical protein